MSSSPRTDSLPDRRAGKWTADDIPNLDGRSFVVTGANSGLGYVTSRELARHGAHVIMAVRDEAKGEQALETLRGGQPDAGVELRRLDLADLDSVKAFAEGIISAGVKVDVLINNGGIMMPPRSLTEQGFESQFGTNHLGHFALTGLLLDTLKGGSDARVVTISSSLHRRGSIHFDDLSGERGYSPTAFYAQSKFANVLFALELDRRLRLSGVQIKSVLAHPGYAATNLQSTGPRGLANLLMKVGNRFMAQSADAGARSQLYAATDPRVKSGEFVGPDGLGESRGHPTIVEPIDAARDPDTARRLWDISQELTGVDFHLPRQD
jgi:NAD(P)-dependent dehydrogenase (short-subunit alcohol dehydrogenase family)